ncbi:hypothetical protein ELQ90_06710 [Labedella phragmitis]|uniref:Glycosyltransferase family 1 protein n=1 Tax=Labedella phragmitis TaxID=2498849 RepID=A0A3S3Z9H4_9MICO|nr:hypothetical protein [Labedella phragmitis]RWZ51783.1 hypothetical protein ELQ90_06710 [Labedella phragmitis]
MRILVDCRWATDDPDDRLSTATRGIVAALARRRPVTMIISDHRQLALLPDAPWQLLRSPDDPRELLTALGLNTVDPDVVFSPAPMWGSAGRRYALVTGVGADARRSLSRRRTSGPAIGVLTWLRMIPLLSRLLIARADAIVTTSSSSQREAIGASRTRQPVVALGALDVDSTDPGAWAEAAERLLEVFAAFATRRRVS